MTRVRAAMDAAKLLARLAVTAARARLAFRASRRAFAHALRDAGLPDDAVRVLTAEYDRAHGLLSIEHWARLAKRND